MEHVTRSGADWDLGSFFPPTDSVQSPEYRAALESLEGDLASWTEAEPQIDVDRLLALESLQSRCSHFQVFLNCRSSANAEDVEVQRALGTFARIEAQLEGAFARACVRLGAIDGPGFEGLLADPRMVGRRYYASWLRERAQVSMGEEEETLAAELGADGLGAWARLRQTVVGSLNFDYEVSGEVRSGVPISQYRMLLEDPSAEVRHAAFHGAAVAWESAAVPCAAALNAMTGARLTLHRHRGIENILEPSASENFVDVETVEALMGALGERPEVLRGLLRAKARALGLERLQAADLTAPDPGGDSISDTWEEGTKQLLAGLESTFPSLAGFARMAIENRWIDHSVRPGKATGGFCTTSGESRESRIFMTFGGTMGDIGTLAHELGHAHHSWLMRDLPLWSGEYPSTVAETASTFAEAAMAAGMLASSGVGAARRRALVAQRGTHAIEYLANTIIRFDIEREIYRRRADGELSVDDLKEVTLQAQRNVYGDTVDHGSLSPWLWVSVPHFYFAWSTFYNYPYAFGFLLSRWLWHQVETRGPAFLTNYEAFLRASGTSRAEDAAAEHLGVDLRSRAFWESALSHPGS